MKKKLLLSIFLLSALCFHYAISQNHVLKLKTGNVDVKSSALIIPVNQTWQGLEYFIIQFNTTPTLLQQQSLRQSGLMLMEYLPEAAYYASCKSSFNINNLKKANVHAIIPVHQNMKLTVAFSEKDYPATALRKNNSIALTLKMHSNISMSDATDYLKQNNIEVITFSDVYKTAGIIVPINDIEKIAGFAFVQYIEPTAPVGEPENYIERTCHRANAISTEYAGGRKYNGEGVIVGIGDDGIIGPHIDYTGRIDLTNVTQNNGDHGDHCSGILMGGGNLNPKERGQAWGAFLYVYQYPDDLDFADAGYDNNNIRITSSSYSDGCNAGYTTFSQQCDQQIRLRSELIHSFSAGNQGGVNCGYYNGTAFGNITGGHKIGKNVITAAALNAADGITTYSSRGPAADGRTEPKVSAVGDDVNSTVSTNTYALNSGTSMSCPAVSGTLAQLYDCYQKNNANVVPQSGLIKAVLMNSCDDIGNAGPDFTYGYGRINAYRAAIDIETLHYFSDSLTQGDSAQFSITVPANVAQLKVMLYWHDYEGALASAPSLVNDLDLTVEDNAAAIYQPLVLDPSPNAASLSAPATPGIDHLNNEEQVVIASPAAGNYNFKVAGYNVPMGVQPYFIVYNLVYDDITVTYPIGGESTAPGETERIRWDAYGTGGTFTISYSTDSMLTWNVITSTITGASRYYNWTTPTVQSGRCFIKVERNGISDVSDAPFSIMNVPSGLSIAWSCPDSIKLIWNNVPGAVFYEASVLGTQYMDSTGTSTINEFIFGGLNPYITHWFSVKAYGPNEAKSRRAIAISSIPGINNCLLAYDGSLTNLSPASGNLLSCAFSGTLNVNITIKNEGVNPISNFDVAYSVNNGLPVTEVFTGTINPGASATHTFATGLSLGTAGVYNLAAYIVLAGDGNGFNDTLTASFNLINSTAYPIPYTENFETFNACPTASDCEATVCLLGNDMINENNNETDDIDWRVNSGTTPSADTGPAVDHTTGNATGQYVYTEASNGCFFKTALLVTPCIDITSAVSPALIFYYHMFGANMGELHIDILSNGVWVNDITAPIVGNQPDQWIQSVTGLANYIGQVVNFRFRGITGSDYASDMALDDIGVQEYLVGINDITQATSLKITPNPSNGKFELILGGATKGIYEMNIFDVTGKLIVNETLYNQQPVLNHKIDLSTHNKGVYHLRLIHDGKVYNQPIVIL